MGIFLGDTAPSKIFVGDTVVSKVFVGDTQVRPVGWQPGANTVLYLPLNGDVVDYSTYNRSFTVLGNTQAVGTPVFDTLSNGKKVANFIATSKEVSNWFAFTEDNTDIPSSGNMTISFWTNWSGNSTNYYQATLDFRQAVGNNDVYTWMTGLHQTGNRFLFHGSAQETTSFTPIVGTRYNMICVVNGNMCYVYKDGIQIYSDSYTYGTRDGKVSIGAFYASQHATLRNEAYNGKLSEVILENKARTAQEIQDYYNQTKGNYGL